MRITWLQFSLHWWLSWLSFSPENCRCSVGPGSSPGLSAILFLWQAHVLQHGMEAKMVCVMLNSSLCSDIGKAIDSEAVIAIYQVAGMLIRTELPRTRTDPKPKDNRD